MKAQIYTLRDVKAEECMFLVAFKRHEEMKRWFLNLGGGLKAFAQNPKDFVVLHVGEFESETGEIKPVPVPKDVTPYSERDELEVRRG